MEDPALSGKYQHSDYVCLSSCPHRASQQHPPPKIFAQILRDCSPQLTLSPGQWLELGQEKGQKKKV